MPVRADRIYAGLTGATKWPSGKAGTMTLKDRIGSNHLRGTIGGSTFRQTLAACLRDPLGLEVLPGGLSREAERRLSEWMRSHLEVAVHPFPGRDALAHLEDEVLAVLDPPLNLEGLPSTPLRARVSELRSELARASKRSARATRNGACPCRAGPLADIWAKAAGTYRYP